MSELGIVPTSVLLNETPAFEVPALTTDARDEASRRFIECFTDNICNPNSRCL